MQAHKACSRRYYQSANARLSPLHNSLYGTIRSCAVTHECYDRLKQYLRILRRQYKPGQYLCVAQRGFRLSKRLSGIRRDASAKCIHHHDDSSTTYWVTNQRGQIQCIWREHQVVYMAEEPSQDIPRFSYVHWGDGNKDNFLEYLSSPHGQQTLKNILNTINVSRAH